MIGAFVLGGVLALAAGAVVFILAAAFGLGLAPSPAWIGGVFAAGGIAGVIVHRRKGAAGGGTSAAKRDIRLPLLDPAIGGVGGLGPEQRVLTHLVRGDASVADLCVLFRSVDQARATIRELFERGEIELFTLEGRREVRLSHASGLEVLQDGRGAGRLSRVLVQITDAGTERLGEVGGAGV